MKIHVAHAVSIHPLLNFGPVLWDAGNPFGLGPFHHGRVLRQVHSAHAPVRLGFQPIRRLDGRRLGGGCGGSDSSGRFGNRRRRWRPVLSPSLEPLQGHEADRGRRSDPLGLFPAVLHVPVVWLDAKRAGTVRARVRFDFDRLFGRRFDNPIAHRRPHCHRPLRGVLCGSLYRFLDGRLRLRRWRQRRWRISCQFRAGASLSGRIK